MPSKNYGPPSGNDGEPLPPELAELEELLTARASAGTPAGLRPRVLAAVREELAAPRGVARRRSPWLLAGQLAAAVLLCLNLALCLGSRGEVRPAGVDEEHVAAVAAELSRLEPGMSEGEARRMALLVCAAPPAPAPDGGLPPDAVFDALRGEIWGTH